MFQFLKSFFAKRTEAELQPEEYTNIVYSLGETRVTHDGLNIIKPSVNGIEQIDHQRDPTDSDDETDVDEPLAFMTLNKSPDEQPDSNGSPLTELFWNSGSGLASDGDFPDTSMGIGFGPSVNPANGLPMLNDVMGNPYGLDLSDIGSSASMFDDDLSGTGSGIGPSTGLSDDFMS